MSPTTRPDDIRRIQERWHHDTVTEMNRRFERAGYKTRALYGFDTGGIELRRPKDEQTPQMDTFCAALHEHATRIVLNCANPEERAKVTAYYAGGGQ